MGKGIEGRRRMTRGRSGWRVDNGGDAGGEEEYIRRFE